MSSLDGLECKQTRSRPTAVTHRIHTVWLEHRVETEHLTGRQCEVSEREGRGGVRHTDKPIWPHAWAIKAAAVAAAVPEQSPPAAQLWGATPESPYWSREWAETHFLWAQATWRKEQKGLRQVGVRWWEGRGGWRSLWGLWVRGWGNEEWGKGNVVEGGEGRNVEGQWEELGRGGGLKKRKEKQKL